MSEPTPTAVLDLPAQAPKPPKKRDWIKRTFFIVLAVLVVIVIGVGIYAWSLMNSFNKAEKIDNAFPTNTTRPAAVEGAQTILLLGSDTRGSTAADETSGRSDTMMVVNIPADRKNVTVMSIMRDNWVPIPGHGTNKINAAMAFGGVPLVVETVESIIDTRIDHVAVIDFESFKGLTEALGGVTINNPNAFTSVKGISFAKGKITLEGADALAFVRERKAFAIGDYQRAKNQQIFMKGVLGEVLNASTLSNPVRISDLVSSVTPYLQVDKSMDAAYLAGLGFSLRDIRTNDVRFFTMPTLGTGMIGDQSVVLPDWDQIKVIQKAFKDGTLFDYKAPSIDQ